MVKKRLRSKRFFVYILVLIVAFLLYFFSKMLPAIYFNLGKQAYENKDYKTAYFDLKMAATLSPKNRDVRYYFVETMLNFKPTLEIQKGFYEVSQVNQPDSAGLIADTQISKWKNQIISRIGENFIEQAPYNNKIWRWDATKFPLKVYIKNNSSIAPEYYETEIRKAFLQWQASSSNLVRFDFVDNQNDSNIDVSIKSSADMKKCTEDDCTYTVAYTIPDAYGYLLKKMNIYFYDSNNLGKPFKAKEIYNTALHEIGHSLGIMGHSYNKDSIMYLVSDSDEGDSFDQFRSDFQSLSSADINTLRLLYKLVPDVTNTPLNQFNKSHQFYAPIVLGSESQVNSRKLLEAKNYISSAPDLPNGYIDLAAAYLELKEYNQSIQALNKALTLCSSDDEKFTVYFNLAVVYMQIKDWKNALDNANMAKQLNPSADVDGIIAMINYNMGNKELAKESYQKAIEKNPTSIIDSYNLATIYIKEFNLVKAGKVLNNLIKANPQAMNDMKIKAYTLITFLFK